MKILIISDAWKPQINGVVRTYEHISEELTHRGHEITVIGPADFPWCIALPGYPEIKLALFPYRRLEKMIDDFNPDVIHIGTEAFLGRAGQKYCRRHGFKFTTCYNSHFPDYIAKRIGKYLPFLTNFIKNIIIRHLQIFHDHATGVIVATESLEKELKLWGFRTDMHRLSRGARLDIFYPGDATLFHDLPHPVALYVGRIAIEKNLEAFLDMDWEGSKVIIGEGPDLPMLKRKYPAACFIGKKEKEDLAAHYRSADIFVFPSRTDTFGMVLVEALASGLPVAAYNVTGPRDIITQTYLGALHDHDLADAAARALALTKNTKDQRRRHTEENYTWQAVAQQFLDILISVGK